MERASVWRDETRDRAWQQSGLVSTICGCDWADSFGCADHGVRGIEKEKINCCIVTIGIKASQVGGKVISYVAVIYLSADRRYWNILPGITVAYVTTGEKAVAVIRRHLVRGDARKSTGGVVGHGRKLAFDIPPTRRADERTRGRSRAAFGIAIDHQVATEKRNGNRAFIRADIARAIPAR